MIFINLFGAHFGQGCQPSWNSPKQCTDAEWIEATFDANRLTLFDRGGHLGSVAQPAEQAAILHALDGLKTRYPASKR